MNQLIFSLGGISLAQFVLLLPDLESEQQTNLWKYVYIFPCIINFVTLLIHLFVFDYETPKFLFINDKKNNQKKEICRILEKHLGDKK